MEPNQTDEPPKPHLSPSSISMFRRCGEQWRRRYVEGDKIPPSSAMVAGTASHASASMELTHKAATGLLLPDDMIRDAARDALHAEWQKGDITLTEEEESMGLKAALGKATDLSVQFADAHHTMFAPILNPVPGRIEWRFRLKTDEAHDIVGVIDRIVTARVIRGGKRMEVRAVRDLKTTSSKRKPDENAANDNDQLTIYDIATQVCDDVPVDFLTLDTLRFEKDGVVRRYVSFGERTDRDYDVFWATFVRISQAIMRGVFIPTDRNNWWCSDKWCGYAATCPFFAGRVSAAVPANLSL